MLQRFVGLSIAKRVRDLCNVPGIVLKLVEPPEKPFRARKKKNNTHHH